MRTQIVGVSCALGCALALAGCAVPSARDNFAATARLVAREAPQSLDWRVTPAADADAQRTVDGLLADGITAGDAVAIAFLVNPQVQLELEKLEISRADLVSAATPPNPIAIVGVREPGGRLASFYPENNVSVGVLQNVLALLNGPERRRIARLELERTRSEVADKLVALAAQVQQAFVECLAAQGVTALRSEALQVAQQGFDGMAAAGVNPLNRALQHNALFGTHQAARRAQLELRTTRAHLAQIMGIIDRADDWRLSGALPALPASDPTVAELERLAPERRLDLLAARHALEARLATLRTQRRWRWLGGIEIGAFAERAADGTSFIGPNAVVELPLLDQRQAKLLINDSEARTALRNVQLLTQTARADIRVHAAELATTRELALQYRTDVLPNHADIRRRIAAEPEATPLDRARMAQSELGAREEELGFMRDYWRARTALARASGDWANLGVWPAGATAP
jgi:cobalt-zinc-cadmium efflux system outer membrane protein